VDPSTNPASITHTAYLDGYADLTYLITPAAENYKLNTVYNYPAFSAYVKDHSDGNTFSGTCSYTIGSEYTNYVWRVCTVTASIADVTTYCSLNTIYDGYGPTSITLTATAGGGTGTYTYSWSPGGATTASITVSPTSTTVYTVTVTDANGCSATASITVKVISVRCGNNHDKVMVCHNTGDPANPTNALCVSAASVATHLGHGDCLGDCTSTFAKMVYNPNHVKSGEGNISVYPSPANRSLKVELKETGSPYVSYQIIDMTGRTLVSQPIKGDVHADLLSVDITNLVPGIYVFRAVTADGNSLARFTVK
jgi:hypothetical protein